MGIRIGVDIGGSFADFAVLDDATGELKTLKVFSRPDSPGSEVLRGMEALGERYGIAPRDVAYFTHGTTVGVNAVVQRKGLRLGLVTTRHFEDVLDLARLKGPDMYNLLSKRPAPLVPRERVFGVIERLAADGGVETPVDEASVLDAIARLRRAKCEGVVIALLHAYRNPAHEHAVKAIVEREMPGFFVSCSSDVWPIIREYERTSTAVIGGYVQPKVSHYLGSLQRALAQTGVACDMKVTKSNGGVMSAEAGKTNCVQMILSGTASGVIGAAYVARQSGLARCMSLDIGGTTADVALIVDGEPQYASGEYIGDFQIHIPSVSVSSIGDGGGSIAWVDDFGVLKVGPDSAGSNPGPVCYGRGGTRATITDAFVVLGVIGNASLGYDSVKVDRAAAHRAIDALAERLGADAYRTAEAIVDVAVSGMYAGVSRIVSRFGIDPRAFALLPFGGAGPMLACHFARAIGIDEIVVPIAPGVLSALGGLIADTRNDFVKTAYYDLDAASLARLSDDARALERAARAWIADQIGDDRDARIAVSADMRYKGQSFEIDTPLELDWLHGGDPAPLRDAFHREHARLYGHGDPGARVQVVALRLVISAATPKPALKAVDASDAPPAPVSTIRVFMNGAFHDAALYLRRDLKAGQRFDGPAVIAQDDCTTTVLPGYRGRVDALGQLILLRAN
ncbi:MULTISPECIES: hydantoinase/oxoprolinase family protein [Burkholderia]|uniref:hydantoinase/oxoprolinase family protein n=1 Tax=Burkholderia TaxID=32008 RepID=UPI000758239F|nr:MULTISPECIES: hydantoinase/oxoprolinase family protein [Burkholderia]AOJ72467.1 hydantoinase [Burkholderia savannae]KVG46206.1 hydantoinase [Burkholderia sp. MSMB0265]KVG89647.1 hydantoinase [Burkholderia sp. MSMB2040]KVG91733.1 hydantoinase [Burkholderia sp. MSMB2041]KVH00881.1 hydantoinase [Burkholderia sp. MSMB2042]